MSVVLVCQYTDSNYILHFKILSHPKSLNISKNETWKCANHKTKNKTSFQKWGRWQLHYFNSSTCILITASSDQSNLPFCFVSLKWIEVIDNLSKLWVQLLDNISQLFQSVRANLRDVVHNYHIVDTVCCFGFLLYQVSQQLWNWKPPSKFNYISEKSILLGICIVLFNQTRC